MELFKDIKQFQTFKAALFLLVFFQAVWAEAIGIFFHDFQHFLLMELGFFTPAIIRSLAGKRIPAGWTGF